MPSLPSAYWLSSADASTTFASAGDAARSKIWGAYKAPGISPCTVNVGCAHISCDHVSPASSDLHTPAQLPAYMRLPSAPSANAVIRPVEEWLSIAGRRGNVLKLGPAPVIVITAYPPGFRPRTPNQPRRTRAPSACVPPPLAPGPAAGFRPLDARQDRHLGSAISGTATSSPYPSLPGCVLHGRNTPPFP